MSEFPDLRRWGPSNRNLMEPPPREFPPSPRPVIHEGSAYILQETRSLSYSQTSNFIPPTSSVDVNRMFSHPPPTSVDKYCQQNQHLQPTQVLHGHQDPPNVFQGTNPFPSTFLRPSPDFSRPPPSFIKPPPQITDNERNIPVADDYQAVLSSHETCSMITAQNSSSSWHRDLLPEAGSFQSLSTLSRDSGSLFQSVHSETQEEEDQKWLREFEQRIKKCQPSQPRKQSMKRTIKLINLEKMVRESQTLADTLCHMEEKMKLVESSAEEAAWQDMVHQVEQIKVKLSKLIIHFQDTTFVLDVKKLINQRRLKRKRLKRRKKDLQLEKEELKKARQEEEEKIDAWREKLKMEGEEKRREKAIKAEADGILGEVRQKQNEALRMQQLLESLITLRLTRTNKGAAHGHTSTPQNDQHFASKIKEISEVVEKQMKEYELEEQTLHVMMEESASHQCSIAGRELSVFTRREAAMKKVLFGDYSPLDIKTDTFTIADHSLDMLIKRRCEWDQFITDDDTPLSSSVPLHWVIPPDCPTPSWAQFQNQ